MENLTTAIMQAASDFGIKALKPYQLLVIQRIMEQEESNHVRNQIVILPTGTGKSLCFLIPAVLCNGITIIVYPLLALMNDQLAKLKRSGVKCICLRGGQSRQERRELLSRLDEDTKIVITTPETLKQKPVMDSLSKHRISLLVVDEAHVISQWGKDFRPAYTELTNAVLRLRPHQILAFTATASEQTIKDIRTCLFFSKPLIVRGDADRPNIIYAAYPTLNRVQGTMDLIRTCPKPAIVFCRTRSDTEIICQYSQMENRKIPVRYYHAGLSKEEREGLEDWFMKSDSGVLVATSAYGMGMDKPNIRSIIHYSLPASVEEYLQESGRAGRDGQSSYAWVVITESDLATKENKLLLVFSSHSCRRRGLLSLMGQDKEECTGCDVCLKQEILEPMERKVLLTLVKSWPFRFNPLKAAYLLCGSNNALFSTLEVRFNPLYGILETWNPRLLSQTIGALTNEGSDFPVRSVNLKKYGNLLYPTGSWLYELIARILLKFDKLPHRK